MRLRKMFVPFLAGSMLVSVSAQAASLEPDVEEIQTNTEDNTDESTSINNNSDAQETLDIWDSSQDDVATEYDEKELEGLETTEAGDIDTAVDNTESDSKSTRSSDDEQTKNDLPKTGVSDIQTRIIDAISEFCYSIFSRLLKH